MGGNALKNTATRRLDRDEFEQVSQAVLRGLQAALPGATAWVIPAYASKADFGDLDVLVSAEHLHAAGGWEHLKQRAVALFHATELVRNGDVLSFDFRHAPGQAEPAFQVDVIAQALESYDYALGYFSFNDLGNLVGRTAHRAGLTHRHDGLVYYFRDGDHLFREILLTRDYAQALAFLGYEPARFRAGFDKLTDLFEYVAGSAYFNRDIFLLENRNNASRVRDRKRKTYNEFLDWCAARPGLPAYAYPDDKREWLPRVAAHFPHFQAEYDRAVADLARQRAVKARFNGADVSRLTGRTGKALGHLMMHIKASFDSPEALDAFVLDASQEVLEARILALQGALPDKS
jgi:hypothetical protein